MAWRLITATSSCAGPTQVRDLRWWRSGAAVRAPDCQSRGSTCSIPLAAATTYARTYVVAVAIGLEQVDPLD